MLSILFTISICIYIYMYIYIYIVFYTYTSMEYIVYDVLHELYYMSFHDNLGGY